MATIEIENIDELRRCEGIDDVELHEDIGRLRAGDHVLLTFMSGPSLRETLPVRITSIRGERFRGRLAGLASHAKQLGLAADALVNFNAGQIHSIVRQPPPVTVKKKRRH